MKIINRYLLKELGGPFLASLLVSTVILASANIIQTVDMVVNKGVGLFQVVKIFILYLPYVLIFTIPISVLSAVLLGFGRLSSDNEITALRTNGVGLHKIMFPVVLCGFIISLINIPLNDRVLPQSEFIARKSIKEIGISHPAALLEEGVFIKGFKDYVLFIHRMIGNKLLNIHIYQPCEDGPTRTIVAEEGEIISMPDRGSVKLKLEDGTADEIMPENPDEFYKLSFREYYMTLDLEKAADTANIDKKAREKSIKELLADIKSMQGQGAAGISTLFKIEIHKKIALAFSNLVFVLIGIPLAITTHRREKVVGFGLALGLFFMYWGVMLLGIAFAIRAIIPPWVGVWSANMVLFLIAAVMLYRIAVR